MWSIGRIWRASQPHNPISLRGNTKIIKCKFLLFPHMIPYCVYNSYIKNVLGFRGGGGGRDPEPPPPPALPRFVRGGVLCGSLMGRRGVQKFFVTLLFLFLWLASLASFIHTVAHSLPRPPWGPGGLKSRMCPPYPHACRKRRLKWGAVI